MLRRWQLYYEANKRSYCSLRRSLHGSFQKKEEGKSYCPLRFKLVIFDSTGSLYWLPLGCINSKRFPYRILKRIELNPRCNLAGHSQASIILGCVLKFILDG
jgi:hypothetical protein